MVRACPDAASSVLRLHLEIGLRLKTLPRHVPRVLLWAVGERHLVDGPGRVLHAHVVGVAMLLATLMTAAFHRKARL